MAYVLSGTEIDAALLLINTTELKTVFNNLESGIQKKVLDKVLKQASTVILNAARTNFNTVKKGESKTNYNGLSNAFKSKTAKNELAVVYGLQESGLFKYRWINYGTEERFTKGDNARSTGIINPTFFFTKAVETQSNTARGVMSEGIIKVLDDIAKKSNK